MLTTNKVADCFRPAPLASPLLGVSSDGWAHLLRELELKEVPSPKDPGAVNLVRRSIGEVSPSGGLGSYDLRPRRLVELGIGCNLHSVPTSDKGARIYACDFVLPLSRKEFLRNPVTQYMALSRSMVLYHRMLLTGEIQRPDGVSLAGALVILHRGGKGAIGKWPDLFKDTRSLYERTQGAF